MKNILKRIEWNYEVPAEDIYNFYLNPPIEKNVDVESKQIQSDKILEFMVDEHEFSQERIEKVIKTLSTTKQKSLGSWLK